MSAIVIQFVLALLGLMSVPAVDDGPCPWPQPTITAGDDYSSDVWTHADGTVFGLAAEEDQCVLPVMTD